MNIQRQLVLGFALITTLGSLGWLPKMIGNPEGGEKERQLETASLKSDERSDATPSALHHSSLFGEALRLTNEGQFDQAISALTSPRFDQSVNKDQNLTEGIRLNNLGTLYLIRTNGLVDESEKRKAFSRSDDSFRQAQTLLKEHDGDLAVCLLNQSLLARKLGLNQKALGLEQNAAALFEKCSSPPKL